MNGIYICFLNFIEDKIYIQACCVWRINIMCLGIPSKIIRIEDSRATIDVYGAQRDISIMLLEDQVKVGDYVLVHAGFAIQKLQEDDAKETLKLFDQILDTFPPVVVPEDQQAVPAEKPVKKQRKKAVKAAR
jgi:hydrogenase expression/formation protein HypC